VADTTQNPSVGASSPAFPTILRISWSCAVSRRGFAAKVATVQRLHWTWIGAMIGFGLVCVGAFVVPGLSQATRIGVASAGAAGAFFSWLVGAIREAPLLRQLGLYCPHCGAALVEASEGPGSSPNGGQGNRAMSLRCLAPRPNRFTFGPGPG